MIDFGALQFEFGSTVARASATGAGNSIARVVAVNQGLHTVEYSNGSRSRGVISQALVKWKVGDWVTVETASGRLVIVGVAVGAAGA